jgi:predicted ATPase
MNDTVFLTRVILKNYKSIAQCSVKLESLNYLIGPNGAGKSNFLDALRLVADSLNVSLDHAMKNRGGINEVRRRSSGHPTHFAVKLEFRLSPEVSGCFGFKVGALPKGGFEVQREECRIYGPGLADEKFYIVEKGEVKQSHVQVMPAAHADRVYLVAASGIPDFRPLYDALGHMGFYNLNPGIMRDLQPNDSGELMSRDGSNITAVIEVMAKEHPDLLKRMLEFLAVVVPGITEVETKHVGRKATLEFKQKVGTNEDPWRFNSENMSDGTLRALGVLAALFQGNGNNAKRVRLVGVEEPETALHPGAAGALRDALFIASHRTQVLVTCHSPDVLDDKDVNVDAILAVANVNGATAIGRLTEADKSIVHDRLATVGELMRKSDLSPDMTADASTEDPDLFAGGQS